MAGTTWLIWLGTAALVSLAGAALIARLINRPLKEPVVRRQPGARRRLQRQPAQRIGGHQRNSPGEHRLQPHGAKAQQDRARPRAHARRHLTRSAHAPGPFAAGNRDERGQPRSARTHVGRYRAGQRHHRQVPRLRPPRPPGPSAGQPQRGDGSGHFCHGQPARRDRQMRDPGKHPCHGRCRGAAPRLFQPAGERPALRQRSDHGCRAHRHRGQGQRRLGADQAARPWQEA